MNIKKLSKRITALFMTLVMVMTLVMSVEPMQVEAAYGSPGSPMIISGSYELTRPSSKGSYIAAYVKTSSTNPIRFYNRSSSSAYFDYVYINGTLVYEYKKSQSIKIYDDRGKETSKFSSDCYIMLQLEAGKVYYVEWYLDGSGKDYLYISTVDAITITYHPYNTSQSSDTYYKYKKDGAYTYYKTSSDGSYSLRSITSKTGYTSGWYTEQNGGSNITALSQISSNIHLYERNIPYTYSVKFNINLPFGASSSSAQMANQQFTYDNFTQNLSLNTYEVPGYDFLGWSTSQTATTPDFTDGALMNRNLTSTNNTTVNLYAVWEKQGMKITYNPNAAGATGSMGMQKIILNTPTALNTNQFVNPGNEGMAFNSWNTASDGSGTTYTNRQNVNFSTPGAMTLYAQWDEAGVKITKTADSSVNFYHNIKEALDENPDTAMTITLLTDDTSNPGNIPSNVTIDLASLTWRPGGNFTNNGVIKGGSFDGAVISDTGNAVLTNKGTIENVALNNVKVKQGSALTDASMGTVKGGTVSESSSVILGTVAGTVANNGTIIGPVVADGATISGTAPKFIVQFDANGHTFENENNTTDNDSKKYGYKLISSGDKLTKPQTPSSTGVLFVKWGKDSSGTTTWDYDVDTVTKNTIIYTIWENHTHSWKYGEDGDTIYAWCDRNPNCPYYAESLEGAKSLTEKVSLTMTATDTIYDGENYEDSNVTYKDAAGNAVADGKFPLTEASLGTITYYLSDGVTKTGTDGETVSGATTIGGAPTNAGSYYAAVTVGGKTAKTGFVINPKTITADMISLDRADKSYAVTRTEITPVVTVNDGSTVLVKGEDKDYVLSGDTSRSDYGTYVITVTGKGNYTGSPTIEWKITDPNPPSGAISISTKSWSTITTGTMFENFFKDLKQVTIAAIDGEKESGVDKLYYYISDTPFTNAEDLSGVTWTEIENGGHRIINANANVYVFAKITDKAGNVTYISSNGIVVYKDSAKSTGEITFTKTSTADVTADVVLNGNTISKIMLGETTLVKNQDYTISENGSTIAFKSSYLQTLAASDVAYIFKVFYNPGGETFVDAEGNDRPLDTEIKLTVVKARGSLTNISDISKVYDGSEVANPTFTTTNETGVENANVTFLYKVKGADDSTYTTVRPDETGNYVVKVTVATDDNYESVSNTAEFSIRKADITATATDYVGVYDGASYGITVNVTGLLDDYTIYYGVMADGEITYVETPVTYKDAGTYTVYYKICSGNYNDKLGSAEVKIEPKTIGITWSDENFVYDGEYHLPTAEATGLVIGDDCSVIVTGEQKNAGDSYIATATATSNPNYKLPEEVTNEFVISPADIKITAVDARKHIGEEDPVFIYRITGGNFVDGDVLSGITLSRTTGEAVGEYVITAVEQSGSNPNYNITFAQGKLTIEDHVVAVDPAVAPTCIETGLTEGSHCSVCEKVFVAQNVVSELGHDWTTEWRVIREATEAADGRKELTCGRQGCNHKRFDVIPAIGTEEEPANPDEGELQKDAQVAPEAPVEEASLDNKKSELLNAPDIFTQIEKETIAGGADARIWLEVTKTNEGLISAADMLEITNAAEAAVGDDPSITYFDIDLFKQIEGGEKTTLHETGVQIKVTIKLPDSLVNTDRTVGREYKIVRLHKDMATGSSRVDVLDCSLNAATGELTFATDRFSTYAIIYKDTVLEAGNNQTSGNNGPATGDSSIPACMALMLLISLAGLVCLRKNEIRIKK